MVVFFRFVVLLVALPLALSPSASVAQQPEPSSTGAIEGRITRADSDAPLDGVNVGLQGTSYGSATDADGRYVITGVPAGTYTLVASSVGYAAKERSVTVTAGTTTVDLQLVPDRLGLAEVVVSATRARESLRTVPASISVAGPEELETQTALTSDLGDVLAQTVPGLAQSTGTLSNYGQTLRGRDLFVLIDGVPQSTPLRQGLRSLRTINPSAIERVEVVRGASALYGYGATGGTINIVTKRPDDGTVNAFAEVGARFSTENMDGSLSERVEGRLSGRSGRFDYVASGSYEDWGYFFDAEGDRIPQDPQGQGGLGGADEVNVLLKGGVQLAAAQRLEATLNVYDFKQDLAFATVAGVPGEEKATTIDTTGMPGKNPGTSNRVATLRYSHEDVAGSRVSAQAFVQDFDTRFVFYTFYPDGGGQPFIRSDKLGARLDVETPLAFTGGSAFAGSTLRWGVDVLRDETAQPLEDGRIYVPPIEQVSAAPFVQLKLPLAGQAVLRGGARYETFRLTVDDYTTLFGGNPVAGGTLDYDALVFNAGGVLFLTDAAEVFASFSQGFSVADVGRTLRSFGEGDESGQATSVETLRPEAQTVNSYEVGARLSRAAVETSLTGFVNTSDLGSTFTGEYPDLRIARSPERIRGVEATLDARLPAGVGLGGTLTYLEGKRDSDDDGSYDAFLPGPRIPPLKATAYVAYAPVEGWTNRVQLLHSGTRDRFEGEAAQAFGQGSVEAYTTVDLQAALDLGTLGFGRGVLRLGVENVLNTFYFPPISQWYNFGTGYSAAPGRQVSASYAITL